MEVNMKIKNLKLNLRNIRAFTLVELLIVIGLLGAIALIVISAINPIEQSNRARDTRYKADAGQLISAIDRYYVTLSAYPWMTTTPATYTSVDTAFPFITATDTNVGLCLAGNCTNAGLLITGNELKSEFKNRSFAKTTATASDHIFIGKAQGSSSSVYGCFTPLSKSVRDKACTDGNVYQLAAAGTRTAVSGANCVSTHVNWASTVFGTQLVICLPE